jgi:LPXTG-motif cell wall-anchored protein
MKTMKWTQRLCIGTGFAVASMFAVPASMVAFPAVAGADTTCYTGCTPPTVSPASVPPPSPSSTKPVHTTASTAVNGSSSLPFTGADIGELAVVGVGAVVIGGVLARRRRRTA